MLAIAGPPRSTPSWCPDTLLVPLSDRARLRSLIAAYGARHVGHRWPGPFARIIKGRARGTGADGTSRPVTSAESGGVRVFASSPLGTAGVWAWPACRVTAGPPAPC